MSKLELCNYYRFNGYFTSIAQHAVNQSSINQAKLNAIKIPLPPLVEQEGIINKIEELFTQLDAGVAGLKRAQAALKRYRASVLKAACEGRLVPQDPSDEPAGELLRRLGRLQSNDKLSDLPNGWCWTTVDEIGNANEQIVLTGPFGSNLGREDFYSSGIAVLTIGCLTENGLNLGKAKYISDDKQYLRQNRLT